MFVVLYFGDIFLKKKIFLFHVRWVPCHHDIVRPQVADGGDGLQIRRVAANILNKQSRTADKGLNVGLTTPHRKNELVTKCHKGPRTWTDSLDNQPKLKKNKYSCCGVRLNPLVLQPKRVHYTGLG
jgi:hypothetical protein